MKIFLLVDDSPVIRKVAGRILKDVGFIVVEASDGPEALEVCRNNMPDAILVDWDLPSMTGIEFISEFNRMEGSVDTRIVYCTSELMISEMTKAKRAGCHGFMMKPFNREILLHKIAEAAITPENTEAA